MRPDRMRELPPELQKCEFEATAAEDEETSWAIEIPDNASVIVSMEVRTGNGPMETKRWGGGNQSGRWELRRVDGGEGSE